MNTPLCFPVSVVISYHLFNLPENLCGEFRDRRSQRIGGGPGVEIKDIKKIFMPEKLIGPVHTAG